MPAVSQAQRAFLNARFGHAWVKAHHFDNKGQLPARTGKPEPQAQALARLLAAKKHHKKKGKQPQQLPPWLRSGPNPNNPMAKRQF